MTDKEMKELFEEIKERQNPFALQNMKECSEALKNGDEEKASEILSSRFGNTGYYRSANVIGMYIERFKNQDILFRTIIDIYTNDGYDFPKRIMLRAKKIRPKNRFDKSFWADDFDDGSYMMNGFYDAEEYTVYRATISGHEIAKNELSWTLDKDTAIFFKYRNAYSDLVDVYQGKIKKDKIIAYANCRKEQEIIQHNSVYDIQRLDISDEEIERVRKDRESK